jgi:hypothetical protein
MTVEELKKSSPVLVNRDVWQRIKNENSSIGDTSDKINFTVIHLYYKSINEVEYSLLNNAAKDCCYQISDNLKELDGYLLFVGDLDNIDDYWKEYIESLKKNDLLIELEVSEKIFENDYFERYTKQIKRLDITYVVNWKKMIESSKLLGIPVIDTLKGLSEDILGSKDKAIINSKVEELKSIYLDPLIYKVSFPLINKKVPSNLLDIIFYGCKKHDMNELRHYSYRYSYEDGNTEKIYILATVDKLSDNICTIQFQSEKLNDKDHYLYFNYELFEYLGNKKFIKKIYDNSEYWTEKTKSDLISK